MTIFIRVGKYVGINLIFSSLQLIYFSNIFSKKIVMRPVFDFWNTLFLFLKPNDKILKLKFYNFFAFLSWHKIRGIIQSGVPIR